MPRPTLESPLRIDRETMGRVMEANFTAYLLSFGRLAGAIVHHDATVAWIDSGISTTIFNAVIGARFAQGTEDARVGSILSHFREHNRPVTWHLGPVTEPVNLDRVLVAHGMVHSEAKPGMALEIARLPENALALPAVDIQLILDRSGLHDWVDTWLFPVPLAARRVYRDALEQRGIGDDLP